MSTKITVNEKVYDSIDEMPPDVRAIYEQAMRAASTAGPVVRQSEIKVMFQMGGSAPRFRTRPGPATEGTPPLSLVDPASAAAPIHADESRPIEPAAGSVGLQVALVVAVGLAIGLLFWYWARVH